MLDFDKRQPATAYGLVNSTVLFVDVKRSDASDSDEFSASDSIKDMRLIMRCAYQII